MSLKKEAEEEQELEDYLKKLINGSADECHDLLQRLEYLERETQAAKNARDQEEIQKRLAQKRTSLNTLLARASTINPQEEYEKLKEGVRNGCKSEKSWLKKPESEINPSMSSKIVKNNKIGEEDTLIKRAGERLVPVDDVFSGSVFSRAQSAGTSPQSHAFEEIFGIDVAPLRPKLMSYFNAEEALCFIYGADSSQDLDFMNSAEIEVLTVGKLSNSSSKSWSSCRSRDRHKGLTPIWAKWHKRDAVWDVWYKRGDAEDASIRAQSHQFEMSYEAMLGGLSLLIPLAILNCEGGTDEKDMEALVEAFLERINDEQLDVVEGLVMNKMWQSYEALDSKKKSLFLCFWEKLLQTGSEEKFLHLAFCHFAREVMDEDAQRETETFQKTGMLNLDMEKLEEWGKICLEELKTSNLENLGVLSFPELGLRCLEFFCDANSQPSEFQLPGTSESSESELTSDIAVEERSKSESFWNRKWLISKLIRSVVSRGSNKEARDTKATKGDAVRQEPVRIIGEEMKDLVMQQYYEARETLRHVDFDVLEEMSSQELQSLPCCVHEALLFFKTHCSNLTHRC